MSTLIGMGAKKNASKDNTEVKKLQKELEVVKKEKENLAKELETIKINLEGKVQDDK